MDMGRESLIQGLELYKIYACLESQSIFVFFSKTGGLSNCHSV